MPRYSTFELGKYNPLIEESCRDGIQESLDSLITVAKLMNYGVSIEKEETGYKPKKKLTVRIFSGTLKFIKFSFVYVYNSVYIDYLIYEESIGISNDEIKNKIIKVSSIEEQLRSIMKCL